MKRKIFLAVFIALFATGCSMHSGGIVKVTAAPKVWAKEGYSQDQMIADSLNCQDAALAKHSSYGSYTSSAGFTEEQVKYYDACMAGKGYQEVK